MQAGDERAGSKTAQPASPDAKVDMHRKSSSAQAGNWVRYSPLWWFRVQGVGCRV